MKSLFLIAVLALFSSTANAASYYVHNCEKETEELFALACNIYFEARGESQADQLAVGFVTLNRVMSDKYPDDVSEVVYEKKQFSWTHDRKSDKVISQDWNLWVKIAQLSSQLLDFYYNEKGLYNYSLLDMTEGSLYYYSEIIRKPVWVASECFKVKIGKHSYYSCAKQK